LRKVNREIWLILGIFAIGGCGSDLLPPQQQAEAGCIGQAMGVGLMLLLERQLLA